MKATVSIAKCSSYDQTEVDQAIAKSFDFKTIIKPGQRVLLKINALMSANPDAALTTHPAIVTAVINEAKKAGGIPIIGDSPGDGKASVENVMRNIGMTEVAQKTGAEIISFEKSGWKDIPSPSNNQQIKTIKIAKAALEADVIINLPKLKTHGFTLYTGAIKNLFGCILGFYKAKYHFWAPHPFDFAAALVDILEITKPQLNIMDAVVGMEGQGPNAGEPRLMGAIMISTDAVALDAVAATAIGYQPFEIDTTKIAHERKLGVGNLESIDILGTPLAEITKIDWKHSSSVYDLTRRLPKFLINILQPIVNQIKIEPEIIQEKCKKCLICVNNCPAETIYFKSKKVEIDLSKCIMCYCCHELCPHDSIRLKRSFLAKLLRIGAQ